MKFKKQILIEMMFDDCADGFEIVDSGQWTSDIKYQHRSVVFKFEDKFYRVHDSRSGSYHSDYYYEHEDWPAEKEVEEVVATTKTITVWETKKVQ